MQAETQTASKKHRRNSPWHSCTQKTCHAFAVTTELGFTTQWGKKNGLDSFSALEHEAVLYLSCVTLF